jgi:hypothetical protein
MKRKSWLGATCRQPKWSVLKITSVITDWPPGHNHIAPGRRLQKTGLDHPQALGIPHSGNREKSMPEPLVFCIGSDGLRRSYSEGPGEQRLDKVPSSPP